TWRVADDGIPIALRGRERSVRVIASRTGADRWRLDGDLAGEFRIARSGESLVVEDATDRAPVRGRVRLDTTGVSVVLGGATIRLGFEPPPTLAEAALASAGAHAGT